MNRRRYFSVVVILVIAVFIAGCSNDTALEIENPAPDVENSEPESTFDPDSLYFRADDGEGGIFVGALWHSKGYHEMIQENNLSEELNTDENFVFEISLNAHAGDLRQFDMKKNSVLKIDGIELHAASWSLISNDSHHPKGLLVFPSKEETQEALLKDNSTIDLVITYLGDIPERSFRWELPIQ